MTTNLLPSQLPAIKGPPQLEVPLPNLHEQPLPVNITITNLMANAERYAYLHSHNTPTKV